MAITDVGCHYFPRIYDTLNIASGEGKGEGVIG